MSNIQNPFIKTPKISTQNPTLTAYQQFQKQLDDIKNQLDTATAMINKTMVPQAIPQTSAALSYTDNDLPPVKQIDYATESRNRMFFLFRDFLEKSNHVFQDIGESFKKFVIQNPNPSGVPQDDNYLLSMFALFLRTNPDVFSTITNCFNSYGSNLIGIPRLQPAAGSPIQNVETSNKKKG